jgi:hypothetical protein
VVVRKAEGSDAVAHLTFLATRNVDDQPPRLFLMPVPAVFPYALPEPQKGKFLKNGRRDVNANNPVEAPARDVINNDVLDLAIGTRSNAEL